MARLSMVKKYSGSRDYVAYYPVGWAAAWLLFDVNEDQIVAGYSSDSRLACARRYSVQYSTAGRAFFRAYGKRMYLDECLVNRRF